MTLFHVIAAKRLKVVLSNKMLGFYMDAERRFRHYEGATPLNLTTPRSTMKTLLSSLTVLLAAPALSAATVFHYDFENDAPNAAPAGVSLSGIATGRTIKVVGGSFHPFGSTGNSQSLLFQKTTAQTATGIARATWSLATQDSGVLTFDNYTQVGTGAENTAFNIHFLEGSNIGISVWWNSVGTLSISDGASSLSVPNVVPINAAAAISVSYSIAEQSYSIAINGVAVEAAGKASFAFASMIGESGFDSFRLSISNSAKINAINYVDNVTFSTGQIPEPAAAGFLMGGAALCLMLTARRRGGK